MKRFSRIAFIAVTLLHLCGSSLLVSAAIHDIHASQRGEASHPVLITTASWIWAPVPMLLMPLWEHHGPVSNEWPLKPQFRWDILVALLWSIVVGLCAGFLVPRLFWSRRSIA